MISTTIEDAVLQRKIKAFEKNLYETLPQDLRLAGKRAAFYCMEYTLPVSNKGNNWPMRFFAERIESDVMKAYPSKSDDGWQSSAYDLIKKHYSDEKASDWWHTYKSKSQSRFDPDAPAQFDYEVQFDKMRKIPRKADLPAYSQLLKSESIRRNKAYQLPPKVKPLGMIADDRRRALIRNRQATMGLAKSGWYAADTSLGGQRNYKKAQAAEGQFIWPSECRRLQSKFGKGIGSGTVSASGAYGFYSITNHVRYADEAMPEHLYELALKQARNAMRIVFELRYKNRQNVKMMMAA